MNSAVYQVNTAAMDLKQGESAMDTEIISALEDIEPSNEDNLIPTAAFAPPALTESQYKQLELLQHLSLYSELIILLSAEHGMGKTFIAKALLASREAPEQNLMLEADFSLSYLEILNKLAEFFDLAESSFDLESKENQVITHCMRLVDEEQGSMLLIIDHADQLADETLEDLNNLALLVPNAFHLMLLATPQFEEKLVHLSEPQAPVHVMEVEPLTDQEAEELLLQAFPEKDWTGEQADYILQQSAGNPGKILYVTQQLMMGNKPVNKDNSVGNKFPMTHLAALLLIASALITSYLYQAGTHQPEIVRSTDLVAVIPTVSTDSLNTAPADIEGERQVDVQSDPIDTGIDFNFVETVEIGSVSPLNKVDEQTSIEAMNAKNSIKKVELIANATVKSQRLTVGAKTRVTETVKSDENPNIATTYSVDENKLLQADKRTFVIQLFGSHSKKNAVLFAKTYSSSNTKLAIFETQHQNKPWHVVVAGPYANRTVATNQSQYFPEKIRQQNPWVRSIVQVQNLIKTAK